MTWRTSRLNSVKIGKLNSVTEGKKELNFKTKVLACNVKPKFKKFSRTGAVARDDRLSLAALNYQVRNGKVVKKVCFS